MPAESQRLCDMLIALEAIVMDALMRREEFFDLFAFPADEETVIILGAEALACAPFSERGDMMDGLLAFQEFQYAIHGDRIHREMVGYLVRGVGLVFPIEESEDLLSCFCLSHGMSIVLRK